MIRGAQTFSYHYNIPFNYTLWWIIAFFFFLHHKAIQQIQLPLALGAAAKQNLHLARKTNTHSCVLYKSLLSDACWLLCWMLLIQIPNRLLSPRQLPLYQLPFLILSQVTNPQSAKPQDHSIVHLGTCFIFDAHYPFRESRIQIFRTEKKKKIFLDLRGTVSEGVPVQCHKLFRVGFCGIPKCFKCSAGDAVNALIRDSPLSSSARDCWATLRC